MLARRRRRREEKRKQKSVETKAQEVVKVELDQWRNRLLQAKRETEEKRAHYQQQEKELRNQYESARQQLEKRRATLLATTSLIPYTNTIKDASNFRVPASLLTLQARLCLHVHCLCVHEELLLKTKEQGWDTIAWMEDVSRQLRLLTQKHISNLHSQLQDTIAVLKETDPECEIPERVQEALQREIVSADAAVEEPILGNQLALKAEQEAIGSSPAENNNGSTEENANNNANSKEESFMDFLQRHEQRKAHEEKAEQMRLAEFRSRGNDHHNAAGGNKNPFTARRVVVGKKLKNYASKLFQNNPNGDGTTDSSRNDNNSNMDESMRWDDINSNHVPTSSPYDSTINEESSSSLTGVGGPRWLPFRRNSSAQLSQSESNLDSSWTLGSSLRGLRRRGYRRQFGVGRGGGGGMETQKEMGESGDNGEESGEESGDETDEEQEEGATNGVEAKQEGSQNHSPTNGDNHVESGQPEGSTSAASPLKNRLKAPGIQKMSESSRW